MSETIVKGDQIPAGLINEEIRCDARGRTSKHPKPKEFDALLTFLEEKVWYNRHMRNGHIDECELDEGKKERGCPAAFRILEQYGEAALEPGDDFEWGMTNGKLAALRWYIGMGWDMLDT